MVGRRLCCALTGRQDAIADTAIEEGAAPSRKHCSKRRLFLFSRREADEAIDEQATSPYNLGAARSPDLEHGSRSDKLEVSFQGPPMAPEHAKCSMGEYCLAFESPPGVALQWVWCKNCPKDSRGYHEACWKMGHHLIRCHNCEPWFCEESNSESFNFGRMKLGVQSDAIGTVAVYDAVTTGYDAYEEWAKGAISFQEFVVQSGEACARSLGCASGAFGGAAGGAAVGTLILPGVGTAVGTIVGSFFCGLTSGWLAGILTGSSLDWLYLDETELHIDTILLALKALELESYDPYEIPLAVLERQRRLLARDVHPDRCRRKPGDSDEEYNARLAESTEATQRLSHHYRTIVAFVRHRDNSNWQRIRDRLVAKWNSSNESKQLTDA